MSDSSKKSRDLPVEPLSLGQIMNKAAGSALRGGVAGAAAMGANVLALMWMRTTINYQYRNGTTFPTALRTIYADGGIPRFYRGLIPALLQGPLSRFGDTAANAGSLTLLNSFDSTKDLNVGIKTMVASFSAALFRIVLMPIDTVKTTMQVTGKFSAVVDKIKLAGPFTLWNGAIAAASATFVGHYPWFVTNNFLKEKIPRQQDPYWELGRLALIGFCASATSDTLSNSIRVLKVYKQSHQLQLTYLQCLNNVLKESGVTGLFFRGLETKILANGMQGILFSILWVRFEEAFFGKKKH